MSDLEKSKEMKSIFFEKMGEALKNLETLRIRTIVGEIKYDAAKNDYVHKDGQNVEGMISEIHLASGDIDTKLTPKFLKEYDTLREYHQTKELKGQEIVENNLKLIREIANTILALGKEKPEGSETQTGKIQE